MVVLREVKPNGRKEVTIAGRDGQSLALPVIRSTFAYFQDGRLIRLPSAWIRHMGKQPRFSTKTVAQYAWALKCFLDWLEKNLFPPLSTGT